MTLIARLARTLSRSGALLVTAASSAAMADGLSATIRFTEIHDRIFPFVQQTQTQTVMSVHLDSRGRIEEHQHIAGIGGRRQLDLSDKINVGKTGDSNRWRVAGRQRLLNVDENISYRRAVLVSFSGSGCTAQVAYNLKPGFTDYRYHRLETGEFAIATSVTATDTECTVEPVR